MRIPPIVLWGTLSQNSKSYAVSLSSVTIKLTTISRPCLEYNYKLIKFCVLETWTMTMQSLFLSFTAEWPAISWPSPMQNSTDLKEFCQGRPSQWLWSLSPIVTTVWPAILRPSAKYESTSLKSFVWGDMNNDCAESLSRVSPPSGLPFQDNMLSITPPPQWHLSWKIITETMQSLSPVLWMNGQPFKDHFLSIALLT